MNTELSIEMVEAIFSNPVTMRLVAQVNAARLEAQQMRARVDAYSLPILQAAGLVNEYNGTPITTLEDAWTAADDEKSAAYYEALRQANHEQGFSHLGDRCPALVMESQARDAEAALIDHARTCFGFGKVRTMRLRQRLLNLMLNPPTAEA